MTEPNLERLADYAAEFLGHEKKGKLRINPHPMPVKTLHADNLIWHFFEDSRDAPILMHIAQEKLEKRKYKANYSHNQLHAWIFSKSTAVPLEPCQDKNKFIAFWMAVESAMKGGSNG